MVGTAHKYYTWAPLNQSKLFNYSIICNGRTNYNGGYKLLQAKVLPQSGQIVSNEIV